MDVTGRGSRPGRRERVAPWIALLMPPAAWLTYEYGAAASLRSGCASADWLGPSWGVAAMVLCAASAWLAWPLARGAAGQAPPVRLWLARVGCFAAGIFALAIGFLALATVIIPACSR
jgi:hypothetical protein